MDIFHKCSLISYSIQETVLSFKIRIISKCKSHKGQLFPYAVNTLALSLQCFSEELVSQQITYYKKKSFTYGVWGEESNINV